MHSRPNTSAVRCRGITALIALTVVAAGLVPREAATAQTPNVPGAPSITSVTAGDRQLAVSWSAASTPADRPIIDYQVMYRAGSSGAWSMASSYGVSYDSGVHSGSDTTWAHNRDPLDLKAIPSNDTSGIRSLVEHTSGGRHDLAGIYRVKANVAAVRVRVGGDATGAATIRARYTTEPITDLRHNGTELARTTQTETQSGFQLTGVTPALPAGSYIWVDGWDHTSTNTTFPEFAATTIEDRRLRIDIATVSTATSTTIDDLTNQRSYQVRVRARNSDGWGAWSNVSSGTPLGTPDAPTGLWLESGSQQLVARWTAPSNNGGNTISDYDIQYRIKSSGANWSDWQASTVSTATTATITGLTHGTTYEVRVRAVSSAGYGPWTDPVIDTASKPSPPTITLATVLRPLPPGKNDKGGLLSITLSAEANGSTITDYDLRYREAGTTTWYTHRDRSHDSGKLQTSETSGTADPIDFGTFISPSGGAAVTRESIGTGANAKHGLYKFSKAVDQLWIRAGGTITGGGTVVARWHTSKPTAATLATAGTQIFSAATESDHTFWQDGWAVDLPADAYVWVYTSDTETLTKRRLQLDFTDNSSSGAMVLSGLQNGKTYELEARASNARGSGAWASASGTPGTPTRPTVDTPTAGHQALDLTWARPDSDNTSAVAGYDVRYRAGSSGSWTSWPHTTTSRAATITGLTNNTEYEVAVRARNDHGNGFWSTGVKGTPVPQAPDAPAAPTLTSSGTTMTVSWTAPSANGADISDYDVQHCSASCASDASWTSLPDTTDSTALTATITGLTNGTTYQVRVRAQNSVGNGPWSAASTHIIGRPSAPAAPTLTTGNARLTATWTAAAGNGSTITDYDVQYCSANCAIDTSWTSLPDATPSTALNATITGLTNGTTYQVRVRAENANGTGPWSPVSSMKAGLPAVPSVPTLVVDDGELTVYSLAPSDNGSALIGYDVRYCNYQCEGGNDDVWTSISIQTTVEKPRIVLLDLTNGTTYYVQVRANNAHGSGAWSPWATAVPGAPTAPGAPTLTGGDHKIIVDWSAPADNGSTIIDYDVRHCSADCDRDSSWTSLPDTTDSTAHPVVITGLTVGTAYQVQVRAQNSAGPGQWSAASAHTLDESPVPSLGLSACDPAGLTQLWVDYDCYIKAGERGIKQFDTVTVLGSGGDYIERSDYPAAGLVVLTAYNPQGGLAIVETSLDGVVQDVFLIDVIRFGIRGYSIAHSGSTADLTVQLHSPTHSSPDILRLNGADYARSWVQLSLPQNLRGATHDGDNPLGSWIRTPIQVVGQYAGAVTFRLLVLSQGTYQITINARRPAPGASCPTQGPLVCFAPPEPQTQISYTTQANATATFQTGTVSPPATPTGLAAAAGDESVALSWDDPSDQLITGYEYQMRWAGVAWQSWTAISGSDAATKSHTITGLSNGTEYRFHVRAINAAGTGTAAPNAHPWYVAATPQVPPDPPATPPATPGPVTVTRTDGTVTANWDAVDGATSYHITYTTNGATSWQLAALNHPDNTITINNADNNATYIIAVRARNNAGDSNWRNSPAAGPHTPTPPATPPATPGPVTVTRTDGTVTANWDAVDGATSYHITYTTNGATSWQLAALNHPDNTITINNADNNATYIIAVRARNNAGDSNWRNSPAAGPHTPT